MQHTKSVRSPFRIALAATRRRAKGDDSGFSLTELVVVLVVISIVMAVTSGIVILLQESSSTVLGTEYSLQQEQVASEAVTPFLHAAVGLTAAGPTSFTMTTYSGVDDYTSGTGTYGNADLDTLTACFGSLVSKVPSCGTPPTGKNPWVFAVVVTNAAGKSSTIEATDSLAPTNSTATNTYSFEYFNGLSNQLGATGTDHGTVPTCALFDIDRVDITVGFETGPRTAGYSANQVTTWHTTVYLQNADTTTTTTSATTTTACPDAGAIT
ncbi:MAG: prepilin-type N-terminal cleavage/methylation domain-containing protein [Acidimicrobiales bacterium]|jgi:prepilin-type N-terminal cleavage/methylation domain-containing protein